MRSPRADGVLRAGVAFCSQDTKGTLASPHDVWVNAEIDRLDANYEEMSTEAERLQEQFKRLKDENNRLEKKLAMKFMTTGDFPVYRAQTGDPRLTSAQYFSTLRTLDAAETEKEQTSELTAEKAAQENNRLETHREKVEECRAAFR